MTISQVDNRQQRVGNGVSVSFAFTRRFFFKSDLQVFVNDALVDPTLYNVTNTGTEGGGAVVFLTAPAAGAIVTILRVLPMTQQTDYQANDPFPAETHEAALDRLTLLAQQNAEGLGRALRVSVPTGEIEPLTPETGATIIFDADLNPVPGPTADQISGAQGWAIDSANSAALALAAAANSADGFPTIDAFERRLEVGDIYPIGARVPVEGSFYQKVNLPNAAKGWGDTGERANWMETVLPKSEGAVKRRFMEKMSRKTFLGNPNEFDALPIQMGRTLALATLGFDGGGNGTTGYYHLPELPNDPPAPSLLQKSIVTSSAGGAQAVVFETPFQTTVPTVILTAVASGSEIAVAQLTAAPTTTGFSFEVRNASGTRIARTVHYFAFGNGA
jgi:hypothetical protein